MSSRWTVIIESELSSEGSVSSKEFEESKRCLRSPKITISLQLKLKGVDISFNLEGNSWFLNHAAGVLVTRWGSQTRIRVSSHRGEPFVMQQNDLKHISSRVSLKTVKITYFPAVFSGKIHSYTKLTDLLKPE